MAFAHLHVHSPFSFLDGASRIEELLERAVAGGIGAMALTDHDSVAGLVDFVRLARAAGVRPIAGVELSVAAVPAPWETGGSAAGAAWPGSWSAPAASAAGGRTARSAAAAPGRDARRSRTPGDPPAPVAPPARLLPDGRPFHLVLLAEGSAGYARLCRLLTRAHLENPRGSPLALPEWLREEAEGLIALSGCRRGEVAWRLLRGDREGALRAARFYRDVFGPDRFFLELQADALPGARALHRALRDLAEHLGVGLVATNDVHYAGRERFWVHDLLTCVRLGLRVEDVHPERRLNAENDLKPAAAMRRALADFPAALRNAEAIAERCAPAPEPDPGLQPEFPVPRGLTPEAYLRQLVYRGARERYGRVTEAVRARLEHELAVIERLGLAGYFLLVWDVVRFARQQGIRCAGRGSAADSAVAYCLYITDVDAIARGLLFERFLSPERAERPDIDLDLDWRHRDRVAEYVVQRYGRERVAAVCTFHTYHARSAIRDLGKALGFDEGELDRLAKRTGYRLGEDLRRLAAELPELRDSGLPLARYERLFDACAAVQGFPRHQGTHLGGLVIGSRPLWEVTPLVRTAKGVLACQLDKEGVEALGLIKLDLLPLRTLGAVEDAVRAIRLRQPDFDDARIPWDDPDTYAMIRRGETVGVFQLESPAQRALQPRLRAERLEDLVASVALIRPGPIKGDMVEPFLARRRGEEPVTYLHPALAPILEKTYGVVLFQEQVIAIATAIAGFTPGEADRLRRVMTHARSRTEMAEIGREFVARAVARGVDEETARRIFACVEGYASYGFCEAHAAAFAVTAYRTAFLARHFPAEYYAALLSHQPMGYYPPHTLALEAWRRGVPLLPPDVRRSRVEFTVEEHGDRKAIRIGLGAIRGCDRPALARLVAERERGGPFRDLEDLLRRVPLCRDDAERLALCGALDGFDPHRRRLLWRVQRWFQARGGAVPGGAGDPPAGRAGQPLPPPLAAAARTLPAVAPEDLPDFAEEEKWAFERQLLGIDVHRRHLMSFFRQRLQRLGFVDSRALPRLPAGTPVRVAGLPVRPHRPPTRSGRVVVFLSLEDEFGLVEVTAFEDAYRRYGALLFGEAVPPLAVTGRVERRDDAVSVVARSVTSLEEALAEET